MSPIKLYTLLTLIPLSICHDIYQTKELNGIPYQELVNDIVKSQNDQREYLGLKLSNQLDIILVSDPQTDIAAASLDVKVGSYSDRFDLPGTAHFLEHLLFMGTEKYPERNAYAKYLSDHSGGANAMTMNEDTAYFFHVSPDALDGALDRFSQFFISPLFNRSSVESEASAVDSEYKKDFLNGSSMIQVQRNVSDPNHPYSKFTCGNYETLIKHPREKGIDTREIIINFYKEYYSANIMKLAVVGKESLEELKSIVIPKFSGIPNRNTPLLKFSESPFNKDQLGIKINIVSKSNQDGMLIEFVIPSQYNKVEEKPVNYISYLIDNTEKGSIADLLKRKDLAFRVSSSLGEESMSFGLFQISIGLTPFGLENQDKVVEIIFSYIKLIQSEGIKESIYRELQSYANRRFQFEEKFHPAMLSRSLSDLMQYPVTMSHVLGSNMRMSKYNETLIRETLNHLNPYNMRVLLFSKSFGNYINLRKEPWFGGEFYTEEYTREQLEKLDAISQDSGLSLPDINPMVVDNFTLIHSPLESEVPVLLSNSSTETLWYINGNLEIPKASINLLINNNQMFKSLKNRVLLMILKSIIDEKISVLSSQAQKVGIYLSTMERNPGLSITIMGFSDKIDQVLYSVMNSIRFIEVSNTEFVKFKSRALSTIKNNELNLPVDFARMTLDMAMSENFFHFNENYEAALNLTKSDLLIFKDSLANGSLEMLIFGNIDISESRKIMGKVKDIMKMNIIPFEQKMSPRWTKFPAPSQWVYRTKSSNLNDINSGIGFYLDMDDASNKLERAMTYLISKIMYEPFFNQLRTKEKLGYIAGVLGRKTSHRGGIWMEVQSEKDPLYLESRIENFLQNYYVLMSNRTEVEIRELAKSHQSLIANKQHTVYSLSDQYWEQILSGRYDFNEEKDLVTSLGLITKDKLLNFIKDTMLPSGTRRRKLSIQIVSAKVPAQEVTGYTMADCGVLISDIRAWQSNLTLASNLAPIEHELYLS